MWPTRSKPSSICVVTRRVEHSRVYRWNVGAGTSAAAGLWQVAWVCMRCNGLQLREARNRCAAAHMANTSGTRIVFIFSGMRGERNGTCTQVGAANIAAAFMQMKVPSAARIAWSLLISQSQIFISTLLSSLHALVLADSPASNSVESSARHACFTSCPGLSGPST